MAFGNFPGEWASVALEHSQPNFSHLLNFVGVGLTAIDPISRILLHCCFVAMIRYVLVASRRRFAKTQVGQFRGVQVTKEIKVEMIIGSTLLNLIRI